VKRDAVGCEVCKPTVGNILSSLWNEHVMNSVHHQNQVSSVARSLSAWIESKQQDTNDRFMANIQVRSISRACIDIG
jgi:nitrite reductase (NAD(P)H)